MSNGIQKVPTIGFITCFCIVVANMIGTGVFTSLGYQLLAVSLPVSVMLIWLLGGVFALCGALSYAEVASVFPRSGGEYNFLGRLYHPSMGFMAGVVSLVAGFAAPVAIAGLAFGTYLAGAFPGVSPQGAAIVLVTAVTALHLIHLSASSGFQNVFSVLKIVLVAGLALAGFLAAEKTGLDWGFSTEVFSEVFQPSFAVSLMFALYAYSGWNAATYLIGEIREPRKVLGPALLFGTLTVMILYLALNASFLLVAPASALEGRIEIGQVAGAFLFGEGGGKVVAILICFGLISTVSAMVWAGPRVGMVMGEDFRHFRFLAVKNRGGIPWVATLFQYLLVLLMLLTGSFEAILVNAQIALVVCSALVVFGVFLIRAREGSGVPGRYRTWGYPMTPALFLAISIYAVGYNFVENPLHTLAGILSMAVAAGAYFLLGRGNASG